MRKFEKSFESGLISGLVESSFITVMDDLYDLIRQDYRELYDEIPTDIDYEITDQP